MASAIRCSILGILRIFPVKPTSPNITISGGTGLFFKLEIIATAMAKSQAGSLIFKPPMIVTYTSLLPKVKPQRFSNTARSKISLFKSYPIAVLRGIPKAVDTTKLCTSTKIGRTPSK